MTYKYFIAFASPTGPARVGLDRDRPITRMEDIEQIEKDLAERLGRGPVAVTGWQQFPRVGTEYA